MKGLVRKAPKVKPGDHWQLGDHKLWCGDTSTKAFRDILPDKVAFDFADPPYNAGVADWDKGFTWKHDWLADAAAIVAVTPGIIAIPGFLRKTRMRYRWSMGCWISNGGARGALGFGNWIYIGLFGEGKLPANEQDFIKVTLKTSETPQTKHKGRKPIAAVVHLLTMFSEKGDAVVDPFLGSGTTLLAAEACGRRCIGGEVEPAFCRETIARWQDVTGKEAYLLAH